MVPRTGAPAPAPVAALVAAGRWREAEAACRRLGKADAIAAARQAAGLAQVMIARGLAAEAEALLRRAVRDHRRRPEPAVVLAHLLRTTGRSAEALEWQAWAAGRAGGDIGIRFNLAAMLGEAGRPRDALGVLRDILALDGDSLQAREGMAALHAALGELDAAIDARAEVARLRGSPGDWWDLGRLQLQLQRPEAADSLERAVAPDCADPGQWSALGRAQAIAGRSADALASHQRALALGRGAAEHRLALAGTLALLGDAGAARAAYAEIAADPALAAPSRAIAEYEHGALDLADGRADAAIERLRAAVALDSGNGALHLHLGQALLLAGNLRDGWPEFAHRFTAGIAAGGILAQPLPQAAWTGEDLRGRAIVVWGEQGIGDDILQASVLPELATRAARVLVHTDPRLVPVLARSLPDNVAVFPRGESFQPALLDSRIAFQCASGEAVRHLRPDWPAFPAAPGAYLAADPIRLAAARERYSALPGRRIGLAWRSKNLVNGRRKSCGLEYWDPILALPGHSFVCLQYGDVAEEIEAAYRRTGTRIHVDPEIDQMSDMEAFLAQIAALDGVVTISNATVHAAGALGVPTLLLLAASPLWTWFLGREDSPWYGSLRLIRQSVNGAWGDVIARAAAQLQDRQGWWDKSIARRAVP
ncbi:hypothetical protein [Magnetospirillum sp. UT-4]|uniref:tetratricopeptide repeat protein n=1 Tax=Magnetospirillum sp. UT-4 TaxID=2681467 RepID=UPI00137D5000|nr:hypothetical protein [Magnetospirillum sp. UT-4]CAA7621862.1 putative TPR repeat-containing protein [Magnetospirillum sp. UT-4]